MEDEGLALQERVLDTYSALAAAEPERLRRVDAERPPAEIHAEVLATVQRALSASEQGAPA